MNCYNNINALWNKWPLHALLSFLLVILPFFIHNANTQEPPRPKAITTGSSQKSNETAIAAPTLSSLLTQTILFIYEDRTPANEVNVVPGKVLGTAFVVGIPWPGRPDRSIPFIVTAKHVVAERSKVLVRFTLKSGNAPRFAQYNLEELHKSGDFFEYPNDEGVDIAAFRTPVYDSVRILAFPIELIASKETFIRENINVSDRIMIPCLMETFPGVSQNYPIFRDGTIALITEEPISFSWVLGSKQINTTQRIVFINSVINEGFSGAPVFLWPGMRLTPIGNTIGGKPWLIGIVHGFFPQLRRVIDAEGKDVIILKQEPGLLGQVNPPRQISVYSQENSAIGVVFPAWRLVDILQQDELTKRIQQLADEEKSKEKEKKN